MQVMVQLNALIVLKNHTMPSALFQGRVWFWDHLGPILLTMHVPFSNQYVYYHTEEGFKVIFKGGWTMDIQKNWEEKRKWVEALEKEHILVNRRVLILR